MQGEVGDGGRVVVADLALAQNLDRLVVQARVGFAGVGPDVDRHTVAVGHGYSTSLAMLTQRIGPYLGPTIPRWANASLEEAEHVRPAAAEGSPVEVPGRSSSETR